MPEEVKDLKAENFERDAKMFLVDLDLLQKKYKLTMRPVITPYGPDFNLSRPEDMQKEKLIK